MNITLFRTIIIRSRFPHSFGVLLVYYTGHRRGLDKSGHKGIRFRLPSDLEEEGACCCVQSDSCAG